MFRGVTKKARREGRGSSEHKEAINEDEMNTLSQYFTKNMQGSLNGRHLQEIVLFNIIYFIRRRGRENLRLMTKNTFKVSIDPKERKYIHQVTSEHDKNHTENNSDKDNEARIYEQKGEHCYFSKLNCTTNQHLYFSAQNSKFLCFLQVVTSILWPALNCMFQSSTLTTTIWGVLVLLKF